MKEVDKEFREKMIERGWMRINDIQKFVPCGYVKAKRMFDAVQSQVEEDGFEALNGCIPTRRLLKYMGLK